MDEYKLKIMPSAQIDILDIVEHLNALSPEAAGESYNSFVEQLSALAVIPERCMLSKDTQLRLRGYRLLPVDD